MPGPPSAGTPPPEVPDEFAEAYRAAFAAALEAQSVPVRHRHHAGRRAGRPRRRDVPPERESVPDPPAPVELPERSRAIQIGTHRESADELPPRDTRWLAPVLLVVLALLVVVGAYVLGRVFASHIDGGDAPTESLSVVVRGSAGASTAVDD